jgi:copper(I)-binding protein
MIRAALTTVLSITALVLATLPDNAAAADVKIDELVISKAWTRVTPPGAKVAGGFLTITNTGNSADRLLGGSVDIAGRIEIHEMTMEGGVMKMRELAKGLEIKPGETVELKPGGYHVMFMDLKASPVAGQTIAGTLKFENAGEVKIAYDVAPLGAKSPAGMDHGHMDHGKMEHSDHGAKMPRDQ